jgi:hypothetical protein
MGSLADALAMAKAKLAGGKRFGPATTHKVVFEHDRAELDGLTLIGQSGSSSDAYTLARIVASECGTLPTTYAWAICEAALAEADAAGKSVFAKVTTPGAAYPTANKGYYGEQRTRWCSTYRDPLEWHHEVALAVLRHRSLKLVHGARRWISCKVQDGGVQNGKPLGHDAKGIVEKWGAEGWEWIGPVFDQTTGGVELLDPYLQCMFKLVGKGKARTDHALAMVDERRRSKFEAKHDPSDGARHDEGGVDFLPVAAAVGGALYLGARNWG